QSPQVFPIGGCCFSALATVAHYLITSTTLIFAGHGQLQPGHSDPGVALLLAPPVQHIVRTRTRWTFSWLVLDRRVSVHDQPVRLAVWGLWRGLEGSLRGCPVGGRERGRLRRAFNDFRRLTGSRREHGLDGLDGLLDLLVAHLLDRAGMLDLHFPRHQERANL